MPSEIRKALRPREWSVESHHLLRDGEPSIDLRSVTDAHYSTWNRNGVGNGGLHLSSPDTSVTIYQLRNQKQLADNVVKTLEALHRSAPDVRVHMRGGPGQELLSLFTGVFFLALAAWVAYEVLRGSGEFSWVAVGFVVLVAAFGGFFLWFFHPWNRQRYYATPKQAARAIRRHGWRVAYRTFGTGT